MSQEPTRTRGDDHDPYLRFHVEDFTEVRGASEHAPSLCDYRGLRSVDQPDGGTDRDNHAGWYDASHVGLHVRRGNNEFHCDLRAFERSEFRRGHRSPMRNIAAQSAPVARCWHWGDPGRSRRARLTCAGQKRREGDAHAPTRNQLPKLVAGVDNGPDERVAHCAESTIRHWRQAPALAKMRSP